MSETSLTLEADVLVCGGGVAGTMAAIAAARRGADLRKSSGSNTASSLRYVSK